MQNSIQTRAQITKIFAESILLLQILEFKYFHRLGRKFFMIGAD